MRLGTVWGMMMCWTITSLGAYGADSNAADTAAVPAAGQQVVRSIELPASTSRWEFGADRMRLIGEPRPLDDSKTERVRYWLYLPHDYAEQALRGGAPLFLFLHGAGERGDAAIEGDINKVKVHGPPKLLDDAAFQKRWPCVMVAPQCQNGFGWSPAQLHLLLDAMEKEFVIDKNRVYVSGISMGGFGSWMCLQHAPERFAAAAPICGGAKPEWGESLVNVSIWTFHGDADFVVPIGGTQKIVDAIRAAGGRRVVFTNYHGVGHDAWTQTYNNQLFYDWLWSQQGRERQ